MCLGRARVLTELLVAAAAVVVAHRLLRDGGRGRGRGRD